MSVVGWVIFGLFIILVGLVVGFIVFVAYLKRKVFIHHFILYDANQFVMKYRAMLINDERGNYSLYLLVEDPPKISDMLKVYITRTSKIFIEKPADKYIKKGKYGEHYIVGWYIDGAFTPLEPSKDNTLESEGVDEQIRTASTLLAIENAERFAETPKVNWVVISLVFVLIVSVVALAMIGSWIDSVSTTTLKQIEVYKTALDKQTKVLQKLNDMLEKRDIVIENMLNMIMKGKYKNISEIPPEVR